MCGRFVITKTTEELVELFEAIPGKDLPEGDRFNVCPTQDVTVCTAEAGRRLRAMRWGFVPHWYKTPTDGPLLINARSETIAEKSAFRQACRQRRCLIPADGFYEWVRDGEAALPWYIQRKDDVPMVFAGIWQAWERDGQQLTSCAIVTCQSGNGMGRIHHREPVTLPPEAWGKWLGEEGKGAALLMRSAAEGVLTAHRVGTEVNSNCAEGAGLRTPLAA